jgi:hypothetical protein
MSGRREGEPSEKGGKGDRSPSLLRAMAIFAGAVIGQYIAGRVFDAIKRRR